MKRCNRCKERKALFLFPRTYKHGDGYAASCKKCENRRQTIAREIAKDWKYPYKGLNDPQYIIDRAECFAIHAKKDRGTLGFKW